MNSSDVKVWQEEVIIPTYGIGKPDKNPMFFEKRIYQGSSGVVYPNAVIEKIEDEKKDKTYQGLFLENRYLKVMILPELGGRIQMAYDKIKERHFVYYNQVIKPALVGLTGPWISGGIEFNWPQHHRPSTFEAIDYDTSENSDGSKTVWVNEVERMFGTKGLVGFTLHPDKAYIEIKAKLLNRTPLPQTFLWWANPAVKVNDDYQSIFPPDVNAVFDHGKRDVSSFPIAKGVYYKVDYSPGTDISRYKNIPVPTSYMAINSDYDFMGGYEHDTKGGLLHVANHHVSPGKKQWTWGHSDFGQAWDRNLTDEDGPYIELMTGVFTDNQPDFTWLMPYEEKTFTQYFLPYRELGQVKNATKDILITINVEDRKLHFKIMVTSAQPACKIILSISGKHRYNNHVDLQPENIFEDFIALDADFNDKNLVFQVLNKEGRELIRYQPSHNKLNEMPEAAKPALIPQEVKSNEQLFLIGQHLEQYRHATFSPVPYYQEALKRDAADLRNNNALGLWYLRKGQFTKAEPYFKSAIATSIGRNPNPYDSEPYYNLGLCLKYQDKINEAYTSFYKATWSKAWQDTAFFSIAQIDVSRLDYHLAIEHIDHALNRNMGNSKAWALKTTVLRYLEDYDKALQVCSVSLEKDRFNLGVRFERYLINETLGNVDQANLDLDELLTLSRGTEHNLMEYAIDYAAAGLFREAGRFLKLAERNENTSPMVFYYLAWFSAQSGTIEIATRYLELASKANSYLCFPNKLTDIKVLEYAIANQTLDAKAPYYLGNLWYDKRQYDEAIKKWELSVAIDDQFPTAHRNLGIAYFNKLNDPNAALVAFQKAFNLDKTDARVLMELDQLYKRLNYAPAQRLKFLEDHLETVVQRDDLYLERLSIYNFIGQHQMAYDLIISRQFHPWEGGEGKVSGQYLYALTELAKAYILQAKYEHAVSLLQKAQKYPHSLGEGKLHGAAENDIFYWLGICYERLGEANKSEKEYQDHAAENYQKATEGSSVLMAAMFYNDQQPDKIFYQGLAWRKLGEDGKANAIFEDLVSYGEKHQNDDVVLDYFAVSLPNLLIFDDDLNVRNKIHCWYMAALGQAGLGKKESAVETFNAIIDLDAMHFGAKSHLLLLTTDNLDKLAIA
jgi:tetratricopeptide (TPR) repeat protein